jgi:hypothetical protein
MISVDITEGFRRRIRGLDPEAVAARLRALAAGFEDPHRHAGLGIRKLHGDLFECRLDIYTRLVFLCEPGRLTMVFAGNHDAARAYARSR